MGYKVLLFGENEEVLGSVGGKLEKNFEIRTASVSTEELEQKVKEFAPDVLMCCAHGLGDGHRDEIAAFKVNVIGTKIPMMVIGSEEECSLFIRKTKKAAGEALDESLSAEGLKDKIDSFIEYLHLQSNRQSKEEDVKKKARKAVEIPIIDDGEEDSAPKEHVDKTILVVDDDVRIVKLIKRHLEDRYNVATATSGDVALRYMKEHKVHLVLLDYEMPEMDGAQVLEKIRATVRTHFVPVIFLTGMADKDKIQTAISKGPQGYLLKPVDKSELMRSIRRQIG